MNYRPALSSIKLIFSFVIPLILWVLNPSYGLVIFFCSFIVGEIIDRCEFYIELEIINPSAIIINEFQKDLNDLSKV